MSFSSMHNDYLDPDIHLWEEEPLCEKCKHDLGEECALQSCDYEEKEMSSPANAIEVLEDVLDATGYELDEEQREVVAETVKQLSEDVEDLDGKAIQAAYDLISTIMKTDPNVYDEIACPVLEFLKQRLSSSWRN